MASPRDPLSGEADLDRPVVFVGPSISPRETRDLLPRADVRPPVARGDLYSARKAGYRNFLIIDGRFSHGYAVSPREVIDVLQDGALVLGSSSMGAIRAAECWPVGMRGIGTVYRLYRLGALHDDDEVVVATDADNDYRSMSCALINVKYAARRAARAGLITADDASAIVSAAARAHFTQRSWPTILKAAGTRDRARVHEFCRLVDIKRDDAVRALLELARSVPDAILSARCASSRTFSPTVRYPGHDRLYGSSRVTAPRLLLEWLFGSGRYQRYVWPAVVGEPDLLPPATPAEPDRPEVLRSGLVHILRQLLDDESGFAERLWNELEYLDELDAELAYWYAVRQLAEAAPRDASRQSLRRAQEEVAAAHGATSWNSLSHHVENDRILGAIPMDWVRQAAEFIARARTR